MMALFSLAWWTQRLGGVTAIAAAVTAAIAALSLAVAGGIMWLRANATDAERQRCSLERASAEAAANAETIRRVAASERVASAELQKRQAQLEEERGNAADLRAQLDKLIASKSSASVCYPKALVETLNR